MPRTTRPLAPLLVGALLAVVAVCTLSDAPRCVSPGFTGLPAIDDVDLAHEVRQFVAAQPVHSGYVPPTLRERATLADGARRLLDGDVRAAASAVRTVGYAVGRHRDARTRHLFLEL